MFYRNDEVTTATNAAAAVALNTTNCLIDDNVNNSNSNSQKNCTTFEQQQLILNNTSNNNNQNVTNSSSSKISTTPISSNSNNTTTNTTNSNSCKNKHSSSTTHKSSSKRKATEQLSSTTCKTGHSISNSNPANNCTQIYYQKPIYSEILTPNCILYIYYKSDLANVIEEHFKRSFHLNAAKCSTSISPLSLTSASPTSTKSKSSRKTLSPKHANDMNSDITKDSSSNWCSKVNSNAFNPTQTTSSFGETWPYYSSTSSYANSSNAFSTNTSFNTTQTSTLNPNTSTYATSASYENCWNRNAMVDMAASLYSNANCLVKNQYISNGNGLSNSNSSTNLTNSNYINEPIRLDTLSNCAASIQLAENQRNKLTTKTKEENLFNGGLDNSNGSFLAAAAVAAAIQNPYNYQQSNTHHHQPQQQQQLQQQSTQQATHHHESNHVDLAMLANPTANTSIQQSSSDMNNFIASFNNYHRYPQYLNFDIGKQSNHMDCLRANSSTLNSHYPNHLTASFQYQGFDLNSTANDITVPSNASTFKDNSASASQAYAASIWY